MKAPFSAWKEGAPYYVPQLLIGVVCLAALRHSGFAAFSIPFFITGAYTLSFFRDPRRVITRDPDEIVCPADGTIVGIEQMAKTPHYAGPCTRISIFLSVFNVHVNRTPFAGSVRDIQYKAGLFKNAMKAETSNCNESNALWLDTARGPMTVRQISGAIARRIVCRAELGDTLAKGERFGMIKLGSRTELYLPPEVTVCVQMKQKVRGGATVVARFP